MSIELKVGEWYETRNGKRVKAVFDARGIGLKDASDPIITVDQDGGCMSHHPCGGYLDPVSAGDPDPYDIIKHLPECTGWDWREPKWRDAKPEDALRNPPLRCRVRDSTNPLWDDRGRVLIGYRNPSYTAYPWTTVCEGTQATWKYCQVLDE